MLSQPRRATASGPWAAAAVTSDRWSCTGMAAPEESGTQSQPQQQPEPPVRGEGARSHNVWVVGQAGIQSFILHCNGVQWSRVTSPNVVAPGGYAIINTLMSIAGAAANDLWAVGNAGNSTLALHWNGSRWSVVPTPNGPDP